MSFTSTFANLLETQLSQDPSLETFQAVSTNLSRTWHHLKPSEQNEILDTFRQRLLCLKLDNKDLLPHSWEFDHSETGRVFSSFLGNDRVSLAEKTTLIYLIEDLAQRSLDGLDPSLQIAVLSREGEEVPVNKEGLLNSSGPKLRELMEKHPGSELDFSALSSKDFSLLATTLKGREATFLSGQFTDLGQVLSLIDEYQLWGLKPALELYIQQAIADTLWEKKGLDLDKLTATLLPYLSENEEGLSLSGVMEDFWELMLSPLDPDEVYTPEAFDFTVKTMLATESTEDLPTILYGMILVLGLEESSEQLKRLLENCPRYQEQLNNLLADSLLTHESITWQEGALQLEVPDLDTGFNMHEIAGPFLKNKLLELYVLLFQEESLTLRVKVGEDYPMNDSSNRKNLDFIYYYICDAAQALKDPARCQVYFESGAFWQSHQEKDEEHENIHLYKADEEIPETEGE